MSFLSYNTKDVISSKAKSVIVQVGDLIHRAQETPLESGELFTCYAGAFRSASILIQLGLVHNINCLY